MRTMLLGLFLLLGPSLGRCLTLGQLDRPSLFEFPGSIWAKVEASIDGDKRNQGWHGEQADIEQGIQFRSFPHLTVYAAYTLDRQYLIEPADFMHWGLKNTTLIPGVQFGIDHKHYNVAYVSEKVDMTTAFITLYKDWK